MPNFVQHPHPIDVKSNCPDAYRALAALTRASPDIDLGLSALIKARVSQLNGCAYCVDLHCGHARTAGVDNRVIDALAVWESSPLFTEEQRIALEVADAFTLLPSGPVPEETYLRAANYFSPSILAQIIVVITAIGAWNRVMIAAGIDPPPLEIARTAAHEGVAHA